MLRGGLNSSHLHVRHTLGDSSDARRRSTIVRLRVSRAAHGGELLRARIAGSSGLLLLAWVVTITAQRSRLRSTKLGSSW